MKRVLSLLAAAGVAAVVGGGALSVAVQATDSTACPADAGQRTAVTHLVNRPDSGNHDGPGTPWALDTMARTVTITCVASIPPPAAADVAPATAGKWRYRAVLSDVGGFVTNGAPARSPQAGKPLRAGVRGNVTGGFSVEFTAAAAFSTYHNLYGGHTYSGTAPTSTSSWVGTLFSDFGQQSAIGDNWSWTYTTNCTDNGLTGNFGEKWTDANPSAGSLPADGDITGAFLRRCCKPTHSPSPSPSASASASASPSESPSASTSASGSASATPSQSTQGVVLTGGTSAGGSLPVTGTPLAWIGGAAAVLLAGGAVALILTRRRRTTR